jgi:hypothetical protein
MLSATLVQLIEAHCYDITARVLRQIRDDPELSHVHRLPESELRQWAQAILKNLDTWLLMGRESEMARRYEWLGQMRFEESVPLHEAVRALFLLKDDMIACLHEQDVAQTSVLLYAEEQLELRIGRFFDGLVYHLVRGYEQALRKAAHMTA